MADIDTQSIILLVQGLRVSLRKLRSSEIIRRTRQPKSTARKITHGAASEYDIGNDGLTFSLLDAKLDGINLVYSRKM